MAEQWFERAPASDAAAIQATVDQFRTDLGGSDNGVGGGYLTGRREINWDGVPDASSAPAKLPADFFNLNSPRGAMLETVAPGTPVIHYHQQRFKRRHHRHV